MIAPTVRRVKSARDLESPDGPRAGRMESPSRIPGFRMAMRFTQGTLLALLLAVFLLTAEGPSPSLATESAPTGPETPMIVDFSFQGPEGLPVQLSSFRGQKVLAIFWASW